ncbi:Cysteine-rich receptor-like protein kinase 29 [Trifolium repens]|nr:Cysteine-rich receptor-like protein kinase 29 [Trifolium repens]
MVAPGHPALPAIAACRPKPRLICSGYMAPEYAMFGQFSAKSDVFSFGVLVLEIISGQKISQLFHGQEDLLSFAWRNWREGTITDIIDPSLSNSSQNEIMRCIHIGLLCVQENLVDRPTMATIVLMLSSYSISLPVPLEPASFIGGRTRSLPGSDMQYGDDNSGAIRSNESKVIRKAISKQVFKV